MQSRAPKMQFSACYPANFLIWELKDVSSHGLPLQTAFGNGLLTNYGYTTDHLTQITTGTVQNLTYTVTSPNIANLMYRKDNLTNQYENFSYDNLDRLTGITYMTQPVQSIAYSGNGNITSKYNGGTYAYDAAKLHAVTSVTKTTGSTPQLLQEISYTKFNKASFIQQRTQATNKFFVYGITYGPDEQRVKTWSTDTLSNTTTRFYAGSYQKDTTNGTTKKIHYITGGTGLVAVYIKWSTGQDSMFYVCKDRQGSIVALLKQNGQVTERYSYDAWGRRRNPANWADYNVKAPRLISRGYTGHEMLDGFGLINMNGRMYDPVIGRILTPDPFVSSATNTQSYNRYSYCRNNPLRYTDPSGYFDVPIYNWSYQNYDNGDEKGGDAGGFSLYYGIAMSVGLSGNRGGNVSFWGQLENSVRSLADGYYDLTGIDNNNGNYKFSYKYNSVGTEYYNALADIANRQRANCQAQEAQNGYGDYLVAGPGGMPQNGYGDNLVAGPGGMPSKGKTRLDAINEALAAFGLATSSVESFTSANASSRIVYYTIDGTKAWISTEKVLGLLKSGGIYAIGLGTAVDITLSLTGQQSWGKTGVNFSVALVALSIGTGPGIVLGVGYIVLDKMGAFDIPKNIPSYMPSFNAPDATNLRPIYCPLPHKIQ